MNYNLIRRIIYSMLFGDLIMLLANQCRPYEVNKGVTDALVEKWINKLTEEYKLPKYLKYKNVKANLELITADFATIELKDEEKIRVGIVGEIFIKYAALGNNNLEQFLFSENVEVVVPGLIDFIIFKIDNRVEDAEIYGGAFVKHFVAQFLKKFVEKKQQELIDIVKRQPRFRPPENYETIKGLVKGYLGYGNKMGEGWLLTGEMLELVHSGTKNIVCAQPFGCLPNHIVGKGMIRKIRDNNPGANIVSIDYDPGATQINQENRIKLMLANARIATERETTASAVETQVAVKPVPVS